MPASFAPLERIGFVGLRPTAAPMARNDVRGAFLLAMSSFTPAGARERGRGDAPHPAR